MSTHYKGTVEQIRALDAFIKFNRAFSALDGRMQRLIKSYGLTASQFGTLEMLYHLGPMCPGAIAEKLIQSSGNMTMVVDNLEKQDLVRRKRDSEDRRQVFIHLTEQGQQLIEQIFPDHVKIICTEMGILTPEEQQELGRLCKILGQQCRNE